MKKISMIIVLLCTWHSFAFASISKEDDAKIVNQLTQNYMQKNNVPGMYVGVYHDGESESYYYGLANREKNIKVTNKTIFEIGSITKIMTALLFAQQLDLAKAQLDNSIMDYMPELKAPYEDMTLKNLATHTSGLPNQLPDNIQSKEALDQYLANWQPANSADEKWQYSNLGVGMLGLALERMSKQKIDALYQKNIGAPLHMQFLLNVPKKSQKWLAVGYDANDKPAKSIPNLLPASGSLKIAAEDMQRFLAAAIGLTNTPESILYPMRMTESAFLRIKDKKQGLGWQIQSLEGERIAALLKPTPFKSSSPQKISEMYDIAKFDGNALLDKTGATDGFRAYIAVIPEKKAGIVILANRMLPNNEIVSLGREILFKMNDIHAEVENDDDEGENEI